MDWKKEVQQHLQMLIDHHRDKLVHCGRRFVPNVTEEDLLQPNDYPELEHNPFFRYEEGLLNGVQLALASLRSKIKDLEHKGDEV